MQYTKHNLLTLIKTTLHNPQYADSKFIKELNQAINVKQIINYFDKQDHQRRKDLVLRFFLLSLDPDKLVSKTSVNDPKFKTFKHYLQMFQTQTMNSFKYQQLYSPRECLQSFDACLDNPNQRFMQSLVYATFDMPIYQVFANNHSSYHFGSDLNHKYRDNLPHVNPLTGKYYNYKDLEHYIENDVTVCWNKNNIVRLLQTIINHYDLFHIDYQANTGTNSNLFLDVSTIQIDLWDTESYYFVRNEDDE